MIIVNWEKHQQNTNESVRKGIQRILSALPPDVRQAVKQLREPPTACTQPASNSTLLYSTLPPDDDDEETLRRELKKHGPAGLTINDNLVTKIRTTLVDGFLDLDYIEFWADHVKAQSKLTNPGGYYRSHFGEEEDAYRTWRKHRDREPDPEVTDVDRELTRDLVRQFKASHP